MEAGSPIPFFFAGVAELADAPDLGSGVPDVQVQVLLPAVYRWIRIPPRALISDC